MAGDLVGSGQRAVLDHRDGAVLHAEHLALFDLQAVDDTVAGGESDLGRIDSVEGAAHLEVVLLDGEVRVVMDERGDTLGNGAGRQDDDLSRGKRRDLFRSHDDILVVRQDEDRGGRDLLDGIEDVLGARVHGLAAGDDEVDTDVLEEGGNAVTRGDGDEADFLGDFDRRHGPGGLFVRFSDPFRFGVVLVQVDFLHRVVLGTVHVVDGRLRENAVFQGLVHRPARVVRVDVDFDEFRLHLDGELVADGLEVRFQRGRVLLGGGVSHDEQFHAVDVLEGTGGQRLAGRGRDRSAFGALGGSRCGCRLTALDVLLLLRFGVGGVRHDDAVLEDGLHALEDEE